MPANAKIRSSEVRATSPAAGITAISRFSGLMKKAPPTATSTSGSSFATVAIEFKRTPSVTPRKLTIDQNANAATRTAIDATGPDSAGTSWPTLAENTVDTAAVAKVPSMYSSTPDRKPT